MHKHRNKIKHAVLALLLCALCIPVNTYGQETIRPSRFLEIQDAYIRGELDLETAASEQYKILYEPKLISESEGPVTKCAAPAFMFLHQHKENLPPELRAKIEIQQAENSPSKRKPGHLSYISPMGKFEIFYDTFGADSVSVTDEDGNGIPDYIDRVAESADSSYRHEVLNIGFTDPIPEGETYKIFVENHLPDNAYGTTESSPGSPGGTLIRIEADFLGFPPNTHPEGNVTGAIYATMAHEFKHAIQYAQNQWRAPSGGFFWSEMDATLMEEVVYDDVNDYYNYIKNGLNSTSPYSSSIFYAPDRSTPFAYWHVSWMIYYSEAFGNEVWREVWELIEVENTLSIADALVTVLPAHGMSFKESFVQNHLWHFASGSRAGDDDYGFDEKLFYPNTRIPAASSFEGVPSGEKGMGDINKLAARYFEVIPANNDEGNIFAAIDFDSSQIGIGLLFYKKDGTMEELIVTGENKNQIFVPTIISWEEIDRLGIVVANYSRNASVGGLVLQLGKNGNTITIRDPEYADLPDQIRVFQNFPNPFNPETNINFDLPHSANVKLEVFDITGRKVQALVNDRLSLGKYSVPFNASGLSSGIYIYRLSINEMVFTKKMTLVK